MPADIPRLGAIAVLLHRSRVLLVQRGKAPDAGLWGFPGGHVEWGETGINAALRELHEETGVVARALGYLTNVDVIRRDPAGTVTGHYLLSAVLCEYSSGTVQAGDDARDARWFAFDAVTPAALPMSAGVAEVLRQARVRLGV